MIYGGQLAPTTARLLGVASAVYPLMPCGTAWRPQYVVVPENDQAADGAGRPLPVPVRLWGHVLELAELAPDFRICESRRSL